MRAILPKAKTKDKKRVGRGYGSGKGGHTAGRGAKGQKSRSNLNILFEGVKMKKSFIKRLPLRRGKGKFKAKSSPVIVKVGYLDLLPSGSRVDIKNLSKYGIIKAEDARRFGVKILGNGDVGKKFTVGLPISKSAAEKIKKAGGKITNE